MDIGAIAQEAWRWTAATLTGGIGYALIGTTELAIGKISKLWAPEAGRKWEIKGYRTGARIFNFWAHFAFPGRLRVPCRNIAMASTFEHKRDRELAQKYARKIQQMQMTKTKWGFWIPNDLIVVGDSYVDGDEKFESGSTEGICAGMVTEFARMTLGGGIEKILAAARKLDTDEKPLAKAAACQSVIRGVFQAGGVRQRTVILPVLNALIGQLYVGGNCKGILNADLHSVIDHFQEYHKHISGLEYPNRPLKRLTHEQDFNTGQLLRGLVRLNEGSKADVDHDELRGRIRYWTREACWLNCWNAICEARGMQISPMDNQVCSGGAQDSDENFYESFLRADLGPGTYYLGFEVEEGGHATAYVKLSDEESYLFDPNMGLIACYGAKDVVRQMRTMIDHYEDMEETRAKGWPPLENGQRRHCIRMCKFETC